MNDYAKHFNLKNTPQTEPIPGKVMEPNNSGGHGFKVTAENQLDRFLILGTEGGTYYVGERKLTLDNIENLLDCIKADGPSVVNRITTISDEGRAPKNSPALFALALCASPDFADLNTRRAAFKALPKVARISTHLFEFVQYMQNYRGWGKLAKMGVQNWYQDKDPSQLEYQLIKYRQRNGWTHNDVLRLAKPIPLTDLHDQLYGFAKRGTIDNNHSFKLIEGYKRISEVTTAVEAAKLVSEYRLPMEAVPTDFKNKAVVWEALINHLPITATIRNLRNMAKADFMVPFSDASKIVAARISDPDIIKKGRVHPVQFLNALMNFPVGHQRAEPNGWLAPNISPDDTWKVDKDIVEALNAGFFQSFQNVKSSGKRVMMALDVSGSMGWHWCMGMKGITPREASAALALVTVNVEPNHFIGVFQQKFVQFDGIKAGMSLDDAIKAVSNLPFGSTNISSPIEWAMENNLPVDCIACYTDNETYWRTADHPSQVLKKYRNKTGINTKFISVSMEANNTTVADPSDAEMLDIVGFDTATPKVISEFMEM